MNKNTRVSYSAAAMIMATGLLLAGCSATTPGGAAGSDGDESTLTRVENTGILTVALANEPPAAIVNTDGTLTGVEIEVLRAVTESMGVEELQGAITPFESMIPGLLAKRWDVIAAGLNMKQSRCEQALFSEPIIVSTQSFAVKAGNPKGLTSLEAAAKDPSIKIGVLPGSFEETMLQNNGIAKSQLTYLQDVRGGLEAVAAGRVDAYSSPTLSLSQTVKDTPGLEVTPPLTDAPRTGSGVVFRKEDADFRDKFNEGLAALKKTPEYASILEEWGFNAADTEGVTAEELCKIPG